MTVGGDHLPVYQLASPRNPAARWFQVWDVAGDGGTALVCTVPKAAHQRPKLSLVPDASAAPPKRPGRRRRAKSA